ncbi:Outer membrane receptor proteins, mostly Fe transport [Flavobacterium omnivorum]|uniref:Outer membrane receptor proteins, mostly Fe transport n=1 Tax=Flavobacterium omnivorum TaxID=178355 RepID=A0A1G7WWC5_9FLAO|nr:outer membrane beta-barrel family protein [Flavobacterium omnivorum]SDG75600.1 Outer membrane receptor proteins, mostly Fe transport [Flavobacterium omnivorum]
MKKIIIALVLIYSSVSFSQIKVTGKVFNYENNPIDLAEVLLINKDSIAQKSELTNSKGEFVLTITKGNYLLQIRQFGKTLYNSKIDLTQDFDLGNIKISQRNEVLAEVVVQGKKKLIERKVDRLVFNVENSVAAAGGDAIDALKVTPGIKVQNDAIKMIGKSGMGVMVDDRMILLSGDDLVNYLKTISSDIIKSIEVITAPPAKYSAEGNSGLINIKLKKAKKDSWSATTRANYKQATYATGTTGGNLSYQKNKFGLVLDLSERNGKSIYTNDVTYKYPLEKWKNEVVHKTSQNVFSSLIGLTYDLTNKSKFGVQYLGSINRSNVNDNNLSNIYNNQTNSLDRYLNSSGFTDRNIDNHSLNLNLTTKLDSIGKKYTINTDYFTYGSNKANTFQNENNNYIDLITERQYNENGNNQKISNFSTDIDFEMPHEWASINFGAKISATNSNSDVEILSYDNNNGVYIINSTQVNVFKYKENNQALYFSSSKKLGEKWELKLGLRTEFVQTTGFLQTTQSTKRYNYYKFFPTLYSSYKSNEDNTFSANYSRRINRPSYSDLNPARWYINSNSYEEGNPFLQPSFSHNLEFSHNFKQLLVSTLSFSKTENGFGQLTVHDEINRIQRFIRRNYFTTNFIGLDETLTFDFFTWWNSINNAGVFYSENNVYSEYLEPKYSGWGSYVSTTNSFVLNKSKTFTGQLAYSYSFPTSYGESNISSYSNLNIAIKYAMLNKKLQLSFVIDDFLKTNQYTIYNRSLDVNQSFRQYYDTQSFRISVSYKFGSDKINVRQRSVGNQEEKNRIGN